MVGINDHVTTDVPTPVHVSRFSQMLTGYDTEMVQYLVDGLRYGFRLEINDDAHFLSQYDDPPRYNHNSALRHKDAITAKINKELEAGRMEGPYSVIPYENYMVSALAAQEKKTPGEYRLLHDLSWPRGDSVNDEIPVEFGKTQYQTIDLIIDSIVALGPNTVLSVFDIEHAYKVLPIHPLDVPMMGLFWEGEFYFDKTLAMGCRTSAKIFERFSSALEWIMKVKFALKVLHHVLDDFLMLTKPAELAQQQIDIFLSVCKYLGIPIKVTKLASGMIVIYLGFEFDTIKMEIRLPEDKLVKCRTKISEILSKASVQMCKLESVVGLLEFACKVIRPGRAFLRRAHDVIASVKSQYHYIHINKSLRSDLNTWLSFLKDFNGVVMFPEKDWQSAETLHCHTDSSNLGFGLIFGSHWVYGEFPASWKQWPIMVLEAFPIMLLFELFGEELAGKKIWLHSDNQPLVSALNKITCKNQGVMTLLRNIVLKAMKHNILFKARWLDTYSNDLADALSRLQVVRFWEGVEKKGLVMDPEPTKVPSHLSPHNYRLL